MIWPKNGTKKCLITAHPEGGKVGVEGSGGESTQRDTESSDISNKNMNEVDSKDNNTNWRCC